MDIITESRFDAEVVMEPRGADVVFVAWRHSYPSSYDDVTHTESGESVACVSREEFSEADLARLTKGTRLTLRMGLGDTPTGQRTRFSQWTVRDEG